MSGVRLWIRRGLGWQYENHDEVASGIDQPEEEAAPGGELLGRAGPEHQPHHQAQIEARDVDQVALVHVGPAAQVGPPQATTTQRVLEAPLDPLGAQLQGLLGDAGTPERSRARLP